MATLSRVREAFPLLPGLELIHRGKVRDTYDLGRGFLLIVATDGISIFDFVLDVVIPQKGAVLTAMSTFWFNYLEGRGFKTHLVAAGAHIDPYLPAHLRRRTGLQKRAMVVRKLSMIPIEFVGRMCLTGSAYASYRQKGTVFGYEVPDGMHDGDLLPSMLFTPTTKAKTGHDLPLDWGEVTARYPDAVSMFRGACSEMVSFAEQRDIIVADTKAEFGYDEEGTLRIGDEFGTPDSSRFWSALDWRMSRRAGSRHTPMALDKELVREWGLSKGLRQLDPLDSIHVAHVQSLRVPEALIIETLRRYKMIFSYLTGMSVRDYEEQVLRVGVSVAA